MSLAVFAGIAEFSKIRRRCVRLTLFLLITIASGLPVSGLNTSFAQETFNSNAGTPAAGPEDFRGNPDCAPPTIIENGVPVTPSNWSCDSSHYWDRPQIQANDPCEAPTQTAACDAMLCSHNPDLDVCKQISVQTPPIDTTADQPQYQQVTDGTTPPCGPTASTFFTEDQEQILQAAMSSAKTMLTTTKAAVDLKTWSRRTNEVSVLWFGNASPGTRDLIRARVDKAAAKLDQLTLNNFFEMPPPPTAKGACAYVYPNVENRINLTPLFWSQPPAWQAKTIIHEISHFSSVGGTKDVSYDENYCLLMALAARSWIVNKTMQQAGQRSPAQSVRCNATSFQEFVADVAAQTKMTSPTDHGSSQ